MKKNIIIYDKNGNAREISAAHQSCFVGKGYFLTPPENAVKAITTPKNKEK